MLAGAESPDLTTAVGTDDETPPGIGIAIQIAALPELGGFVKATTPLSLRKPLILGTGMEAVPVVRGWGLQAPVPAMGTNESPFLLPMNRAPHRFRSIWPCVSSPGTKKLSKITAPAGALAKKLPRDPLEVPHQVHAGGGVSFKPATRTGIPPEGIM
jgi:hypothetical protein